MVALAHPSVVALLAGIGLASGFGALLRSVSRDLDLPTTVPAGALVLLAAGAITAVLLAASLPARRAARIDLLRAIATE